MPNWNSDLTAVKPGDWICTTKRGWVQVSEVKSCEHYSVVVYLKGESLSFTPEGKLWEADVAPSAFVEPPEWLLKFTGPKPCEFKKGDKVLVSDTGDELDWKRRYFSHYKGGRYLCFLYGADEWGSEGKASSWSFCKKWEEDEK